MCPLVLTTSQMLATIVVLRTSKMLGVISFPDMDLSIPGKVIEDLSGQES